MSVTTGIIALAVIIYLLIGELVLMGQLIINSHIYDDKRFFWDYWRLLFLWPLVVTGVIT